jgi:hypothetical protein
MAHQYQEASFILKQIEQGLGSLRSLIYRQTKTSHIPTVFALVTETIKCKSVLNIHQFFSFHSNYFSQIKMSLIKLFHKVVSFKKINGYRKESI